MGVLVNIIYAFVLTRWSFTHPTRYVIGYLVYVSSYLGWFSGDILIGGVEYGEFLFNLLALLPVLCRWKELEGWVWKIMLCLFLFYVYGLVKPVADGHQGWIQSVKSSKSMTAYFFLFYVLAFYRSIDFDKVFRFITMLSVYYSVLYLVNAIGIPIRPPAYIKGRFIQCFYDSFLLLALCFQFTGKEAFTTGKLLLTSLLIVGLYIGGYFSLLAVAVFLAVVFVLPRTIRHPLVWILLLLSVALFLVIALHGESLWQLWEGRQEALDSRGRYNEFRWQLIAREFWGGYGYLSRDTRLVSLSARADNSSYMTDLSFIDAGYVDLMGRFGLIGTVLFLLVPLWFLRIASWNRQTLPYLLLILFFYAVNMTWSVFSYPQGIIVLALVYAYLYQNKKLEKWQES